MPRCRVLNVWKTLTNLGYMLEIRLLQNMGGGSAILFNIMQEAFETLHAHKVICEVLAFNATAIHLYEKFGMQNQGYLRII